MTKRLDTPLTCCDMAMQCIDSRPVDHREGWKDGAQLVRRRRFKCPVCNGRQTTFELTEDELDRLLVAGIAISRVRAALAEPE